MSVESAKRYQCGVGMVEVLVTLVLLGVGLLGALVLQTNGLSSNTRATFVTEAQFAAQDMADRILAFGNATSSDNTNAGKGEYGKIDTRDDDIKDPKCIASGCSAAQTIEFDKYQWRKLLQDSSLPGARGQVEWSDPTYTIRVMWDRDRQGADQVDCSKNNSKEFLTCFEMQVRL